MLALGHPSGDDMSMAELKTDTAHLPGRARRDLARAVEILRDEFGKQVARRNGRHIREGRILMARDAQQMTSYLRRGRVDWVTETAGTAEGGLRP